MQAQPFFPHLKEWAIRDRAEAGRMPAVRIGKHWRFHECDVRRAAPHG